MYNCFFEECYIYFACKENLRRKVCCENRGIRRSMGCWKGWRDYRIWDGDGEVRVRVWGYWQDRAGLGRKRGKLAGPRAQRAQSRRASQGGEEEGDGHQERAEKRCKLLWLWHSGTLALWIHTHFLLLLLSL